VAKAAIEVHFTLRLSNVVHPVSPVSPVLSFRESLLGRFGPSATTRAPSEFRWPPPPRERKRLSIHTLRQFVFVV
jgi:hypothetical protein